MSNYYVTKYALTEGILVVPENLGHVSNGYLYVEQERTTLCLQVGKRDWFTSLEEAQVRVRQLVQAKIASLEIQLAKLRSYEPPMVEWRVGGGGP